jgi:hypothetical protein
MLHTFSGRVSFEPGNYNKLRQATQFVVQAGKFYGIRICFCWAAFETCCFEWAFAYFLGLRTLLVFCLCIMKEHFVKEFAFRLNK